MKRIESVDVVRGAIMIVMALDHTRDFFGMPGDNPTNLSRASAALFLTRWITHFCAPVFFLLTGTGAYLALRKRSIGALSSFLFTRGLWLIVLEVVVLRCLGYQFNFDYRLTLLIVLWALGWSMITLSALVRLPLPAITAFGLVLIAGHNLLDGIRPTTAWLTMLHGQGFVINGSHAVFVAYPLIPWVGVTAVGFGLGRIYDWPGERRRAFLLRAGLLLSAAFIVLRGVNMYGDPSRWRHQASSITTVLSFLNATKQPPSLLFLLMTLGPALLLLCAAERGTPRWLQAALVLGKAPLFYYVLHFMLLHLLAVGVAYARYGDAHWMFESPDVANYPFTPPPGWGFPLPVVYAIWIGVVVALYPLCAWFADLKQRRRDPWLSYL
ncbi:MAG TPA: heparan-alpha-glucosaminide N-acetyltransferase domain-containing protein [Vicinamibacterales bacterium]|nr:heparan-alpha-glucosaminide N-acetyltransferase domain-containing protein [Vicinamibacterales bacterium]